MVQQALVAQAAGRDTVLICRTCFHREDEELNWWLLFVPIRRPAHGDGKRLAHPS